MTTPARPQTRRPDAMCKGCGKPLGADFVLAMDARWHREHFVCSGCRKPIGETSFAVREGKPYHAACSLALCPRCDCCGIRIEGHYRVDGDERTFCEPCHFNTTYCAFCGRTLCAGDSCGVCGEAIADVRKARIHMGRVVEWVHRHGVPLRWPVERIELRCVRDVPEGGHPSPLMQHRWGLTTVNWTEQRSPRGAVREYQVLIHMQNTLPETVFRGVMAHELGHVWMMTEGLELAPDECEGVCELFAFLYYKSLGSSEGERQAKRIRENPCPLYGDGFRKVFRLFEQVGMTSLCAGLLQGRRLPRAG